MPSVCHQTTRPKRAALMQERGRCTRFWVTGSLNLSTEDGWGGMNEYLIALLFWEGGDIMQMGHGLCFSIQFCQLITNPPGFPTSIFKEPNFCLPPHPPSNIPSAVSHNPKFISQVNLAFISVIGGWHIFTFYSTVDDGPSQSLINVNYQTVSFTVNQKPCGNGHHFQSTTLFTCFQRLKMCAGKYGELGRNGLQG